MAQGFSAHLLDLGRRELGAALATLCDAVEAEESSLLVPGLTGYLTFFASTNAQLAAGSAPPIPVQSSFTGLAFVSGQAIAIADAARQPGHHPAIDALVSRPTREFAAVPMIDRSGETVGVLTLANRRVAPGARAGQPFAPAELAEGERVARDLAEAVALLRALSLARKGAPEDEAELARSISALRPFERRTLRKLVATLAAEGRTDDDEP